MNQLGKGFLAVIGLAVLALSVSRFLSPPDAGHLVGAAEPRASATPVDLAALIASYKGNELSADTAYKGRLIQVTGLVGDVKNDILNRPYVIVGTGKEFETAVQCSLAASAVSRGSMLTRGEAITVRGTVSGLLLNVLLDNCEIQ